MQENLESDDDETSFMNILETLDSPEVPSSTANSGFYDPAMASPLPDSHATDTLTACESAPNLEDTGAEESSLDVSSFLSR